MAAARGKDLLKVLANRTNREVLTLLRAEATYPRRIAELVGITEGEAQKRLRLMEEHGLVKGQWVHVGKNVKRYTLEARALRIEVGPDGLTLQLEGAGREPVRLASSAEEVPSAEVFAGRARELDALRGALAGKPAAALLGIAGVGKSSLAARLARTDAGPVLWTTLRGTEGAPQLLSRLAVFLNGRGQRDLVASFVQLDAANDLNPQMALVAEGLGREHALMVVDDAHAARDEGLRTLLGFLVERAGPYRVLLAGRSLPKGLPRARIAIVSLGGMDEPDTAALLGAHGLQVEPGEAGRVHAKTGGHPLALTLLAEAARRKGPGPGELAALLPETGIEAWLWEEVFSELAAEERAFLSRVAVLRGPFDAALAEEVAADPRARERLFALERRNLCVAMGEAWAVHDVVRQFAARLGKPGPETHARAAQALEARGGLTDALEAFHHHLEAGRSEGALAIARREHEGQAYRFVDVGLAEAYGKLLDRLAPKVQGLDRALVLLEAARCRLAYAGALEAAKALDAAAPELGPRAPAPLRARHQFLQARAAHLFGDYPLSGRLYLKAAGMATKAGDGALLQEAMFERANALEDAGRMADAERAFRRALAQARKDQDLQRVALIEGGLARIAVHRRPREALAHLERSLEAARATRLLRVEASVQRSMGEYWMFRGDAARAWDAVQDYLRSARRLGDAWTLCCALMDAAWVAHRRGDWPKVGVLCDEVEDIHRRVPMPYFHGQAEALRLCADAVAGRWDAFEARARGFHAHHDAMAWFYAGMLIRELGTEVRDALTEEARPMAGRLLRERTLEPWIRDALAGWLEPGARRGSARRPRPVRARRLTAAGPGSRA